MISSKTIPAFIQRLFKFLSVSLLLCLFTNSGFAQDLPFYNYETLIQGSDYSQIGALSITDYDQDEDQDILVLDQSNNSLNVLINDGNGNFDNTKVLSYLPESYGSGYIIHSADFNQDGQLDLLLGNYLLNQDNNNEFSVVLVDTTLNNRSVDFSLYGDIDNDGDLDILIGETLLNYYKNDGEGNFELFDDAINDSYEAPILIDVNQDGFLDLLTGNSGLYINDNGSLFETQDSANEYVFINAVAKDIDGDGDSDFVSIRQRSNPELFIFYNDGTGGGQLTAVNDIDFDASISDVFVDDINGDVAPDIIATSNISDRVFLYRNDGLGGFENFEVLNSANGLSNTGKNFVKTGDLDNDGINEIIYSNSESDKIKVIDGIDSELTIQTVNATPHYSPLQTVHTYDITQNGALEVIPVGLSGASIYATNETGELLSDPLFEIYEEGISEIRFLDFDSDDDIDFIVNVDTLSDEGIQSAFSVWLYENDGNQNFSRSKLLEWDESLSDLNSVPDFKDAVDFDNDGDTDLIFRAGGDYTVIYLQEGGVFSLEEEFPIYDLSYVLFSDEDNDGTIELYGKNYINWSTSSLTYFEYNNENNSGEGVEIYENDPTYNFKITDFNSDGINDFYFSGSDAINIILSNESAFDYRDTPLLVGGEFLSNTSATPNFNAGDIDQDEDIDLIFDNYNSDENKYYLVSYLNDEIGTFGGKFDKLENLELNPYAIGSSFTTGDVNNDNKLDIITAQRDINEVGTLFNVFGEVISPEPVSIITPENQSTIKADTLVFKWTTSIRATSYTLVIAKDSLFSENLFELNIDAPDTVSAPDNPFDENTNYYWRVKANNSGGSSDWSNTFRFTTDLTVSNDIENASMPSQFTLSQNYPNPFNPTTQIRYGLPKAAQVRLLVFNILGQSVMELVNERKNAGYHTVNFDASSLSSGIYIYRLTAGSYTQTNKMMLIK